MKQPSSFSPPFSFLLQIFTNCPGKDSHSHLNPSQKSSFTLFSCSSCGIHTTRAHQPPINRTWRIRHFSTSKLCALADKPDKIRGQGAALSRSRGGVEQLFKSDVNHPPPFLGATVSHDLQLPTEKTRPRGAKDAHLSFSFSTRGILSSRRRTRDWQLSSSCFLAVSRCRA